MNVVGPRNYYSKPLMPVLIGSTDVVTSTDIGRFVFKSSNHAVLGTGGSSFSTSIILGYIAAVPTNTSGGSSVPAYIRKLNPTEELECRYSTVVGSTAHLHPATTDIGKYVGFSSVATVAGCVLDMNNLGNTPGTSDARWLQITGFSTNRRMVYGFPVFASSVIAW